MKNIKFFLLVVVLSLLCSFAYSKTMELSDMDSSSIVSELEQHFINAEPVSLSQLSDEALDSSLFAFVPTVDYGDVMQTSDSTTFTTEFQPSDSYWAPHCNEEDVYLARLRHIAGADDSWDLRLGKGGQIYSFIGPYGEGVPPSSNEKSRWNDEVWQPVSVNTDLNNGDAFDGVKSMKYYIHGAGNYINEDSQTNTFYSPLMASWYNESEKAYYTNNWGQQAHVPSLYKSGILYTTKYKDIGEGVLEVTYVVQNFGDDIQNHLNVPWGGVRSSNLRGQYLSMPDQTVKVNMKNTGSESGNYDIDETGGFFIFANDTVNATAPSMGIVFGDEIKKDELSDHNLSNIYFRHAQVGGDTNPRDYSLFVVIPKLEVKPGETFYYRVYYVNGNRDFVHQKSKELVPFVEYGFIESPTDETPLVSIKSADLDGALTQDIHLFASPVKDNVPFFLMENTETGERYISPDLYHNVNTETFTNPYSPESEKYETYENREVNRPYDGKVKYLKLLGYGIKKDLAPSSDIRYGLLDTMIVDRNKVVITDEHKFQVLIPLSFSEEGDVDAYDDGLVEYNNFSGESIVVDHGTVALTYTDSVDNPDVSDGNNDLYVGKAVRGAATHANIRFDLPDYIDLSQQSTITLKAYFETAETVLPENCKISVILRSGDGSSGQYVKSVDIPVLNEWTTLSFDVSGAAARGKHDQLWLFFSMADATGDATGQVFYIDDLRGPGFYIDSYSAATSTSYDTVIIDLSDNDGDLSKVIKPFFILDRVNGGEDIDIVDVSYDADNIYLALDSTANLTYLDNLELTYFSGDIVDAKGKSLPYFNQIKVRNGNVVNFKVIDGNTKEPISRVALDIDGLATTTDVQGEISFKMPTGDFNVELSKQYYSNLDTILTINSDINSTFEMSVIQADLHIRVTDGTSIIEGAELMLNGVMQYTNASGEVDYTNLDVLKSYGFHIAADGYVMLKDSIVLLSDTTLVISLDFVSGINDLVADDVILSPNPAHDFLMIETQKEMARLNIFSIDGRLLFSELVNGKTVKLTLPIETTSLLFVNVILRDGYELTKKVIVNP